MPVEAGYNRNLAVNARNGRQIPLSGIYKFRITEVDALDADGYFVDQAGPNATTITLDSTSASIGALWSSSRARPDYPRNVVVTVDHGSSVVACSGTITGLNFKNEVITEAWSVTAGTTQKVYTGAIAFAEVTSVTVTSASNATTNTIDIGTGNVFGIPCKISRSSTDTAVAELIADHATFRTNAVETETLIEELHDDHATFKTAVDQTETLIEELHDDHATFRTNATETETLIEELHDDAATNKTIIDELKADFNLLRTNMFNMAFTAGGLAEGTNSATIKTVNTVNYIVDGQLYTKAATDNIAITATAQQAVSTFCLYLVTIDAAGAVTVTKGTELGSDAAVLPAKPASSAVIGAFKIATDGVTTYTGGTTDNGAAGITDTYYDLAFCNSGADAATAVAASSAATLTAPKPASPPAALSAAKPASAPATLTAPKPASPPATLTATSIGNADGVVTVASSSATADPLGTFAPTTAPDGNLSYTLWLMTDDPEAS